MYDETSGIAITVSVTSVHVLVHNENQECISFSSVIDGMKEFFWYIVSSRCLVHIDIQDMVDTSYTSYRFPGIIH